MRVKEPGIANTVRRITAISSTELKGSHNGKNNGSVTAKGKPDRKPVSGTDELRQKL
jgi:hypothetical protein